MELKNQVCSLENAKRLKELGMKQESLFYWYNSQASGGEWIICAGKGFARPIEEYTDGNVISAFTVAELGEMLPPFYQTQDVGRLVKNDAHWWECKNGSHEFYADTEAEARAAMLIYLLENKLTPSHKE